jgi:hypothetical protein
VADAPLQATTKTAMAARATGRARLDMAPGRDGCRNGSAKRVKRS